MLYLNGNVVQLWQLQKHFSWYLKQKQFHEGIHTTNSTALQDPLENCTWWFTSIVINPVNVFYILTIGQHSTPPFFHSIAIVIPIDPLGNSYSPNQLKI